MPILVAALGCATTTPPLPPIVTTPVPPGTLDGWGTLEVAVRDGWAAEATDVVVLTDGALCAIGTLRQVQTTSEWNPDLPTFVLRITPDGQPDPAFGAAGVVVLEGSGPAERAAPGPEGSCWVTARGDTFVRLGVTGAVEIEAQHPDGVLHDLVAEPDGTLLAAVSDGGATWVHRFDAEGTPDPGFGAGGAAALPIDCEGSTFCSWGAVARLPDGGVIAGGFHPAVVSRLEPDGALDASWGPVTSAGGLRVIDAALAADGAFLLAGSPYDDVLAYTVPAVEPIAADGTLEPMVTAPLDGGFDLASLAAAPGGDLWVAGRVSGPDGDGPALLHLVPDAGEWVAEPPLLPVPLEPSSTSTFARVRLDADGTVVAVGTLSERGTVLVLTEEP